MHNAGTNKTWHITDTDKHTWYRVAPQLKINLAKLDWCLNKTENAITKRGILNLDVHQDQRILYTLYSKLVY